MGKLVRISEAAKLSGFSVTSLDKWGRSGELEPDYISESGHRYYDVDKLTRRIDPKSKNRIVACYYRSLEKDKNQEDILQAYCISKGYQFKIIPDVKNDNTYDHSGLSELLINIIDAKVYKIVILNKSQLGVEYNIIESLCNLRNSEIEIINHTEEYANN